MFFRNRWVKKDVVRVPRLAPPRAKLEVEIRKIEARCGVQAGENGRMAFKPFQAVVQELANEDPGKFGMPDLVWLVAERRELAIGLCYDATGCADRRLPS